MGVILGCKERRLVVIEPPRDTGRSRVLEVHDGILVTRELGLIKECAGPMYQAMKFVVGPGGDALTVKASEQRSRARSVETFVVIEDADPQNLGPSCR